MTRAIAADQAQQTSAAYALYCEALEHFMAAIQYETDPARKQALKEGIEKYIKRAEVCFMFNVCSLC